MKTELVVLLFLTVAVASGQEQGNGDEKPESSENPDDFVETNPQPVDPSRLGKSQNPLLLLSGQGTEEEKRKKRDEKPESSENPDDFVETNPQPVDPYRLGKSQNPLLLLTGQGKEDEKRKKRDDWHSWPRHFENQRHGSSENSKSVSSEASQSGSSEVPDSNSSKNSACSYSTECPKIHPMKDVDFEKYSGEWIEWYHARDVDYKCAHFDYMYDSGSPAKYNVSMLIKDKSSKNPQGFSDVSLDGKCQDADYMKFNKGENQKDDRFGGLDIFILYTDYKNTVEYGCNFKDGKIEQTLCVQARPGLAKEDRLQMDKIKEILEMNGIDPDIIVKAC